MKLIGTAILASVFVLNLGLRAESRPSRYDVVVFEATPGGIAAAIAAARQGDTVALIESQNHIGGMMASGLSKSDIETNTAISGIFDEFIAKVYDYYVKKYGKDSENVKLCQHGYYYEPSVAEEVLNRMVRDEPRITLWKHWRLEGAVRTVNRLTGIQLRNLDNGESANLSATVFIDASYEGDLAATAGAAYRVGRESRIETGELNAGVLYMDYDDRRFLPGTTGAGDKRIQAYTYRLCLTDDPSDSYILTEPPPGYDRKLYLGYIDDWKAGRMGPPKVMKSGVGYFAPTFNTVVRALSISAIPNHKFDVNINPRPLGFFFGGENYDYPDGDWSKRDEIARTIRNQTIGLLYFLQNDSEIPPEQRRLARKYNLPKDEFVNNGHFPWQLYVREARRIEGSYTLKEQDMLVGPELGRTPTHEDSIAAGEFPIDSYPVRKHEPGHPVLEGYIMLLDELTHPYQIPYGVMVPKTLDGLLVPIAISASHVAFSSIRMEPTWMVLGQAAGTAAHLAVEEHVAPRAVDMEALQRQLIHQGQVLTYFNDVNADDPAHDALQYFGTKGFFREYAASSGAPVAQATASEWLKIVFPGHTAKIDLALQGEGGLKSVDLEDALSALGAPVPKENFGPGALTRGQFCKMLYDSLGLMHQAKGVVLGSDNF